MTIFRDIASEQNDGSILESEYHVLQTFMHGNARHLHVLGGASTARGCARYARVERMTRSPVGFVQIPHFDERSGGFNAAAIAIAVVPAIETHSD